MPRGRENLSYFGCHAFHGVIQHVHGTPSAKFGSWSFVFFGSLFQLIIQSVEEEESGRGGVGENQGCNLSNFGKLKSTSERWRRFHGNWYVVCSMVRKCRRNFHFQNLSFIYQNYATDPWNKTKCGHTVPCLLKSHLKPIAKTHRVGSE